MNIHSNARTCPNSRATIVAHVKARAWSADQAFAMGVSIRTGFKWSRRFREEGLAGLLDRSSRPHRIPNQTAPERTELVLKLRRCRLTALEIAPSCGCRGPRWPRCSSGWPVAAPRSRAARARSALRTRSAWRSAPSRRQEAGSYPWGRPPHHGGPPRSRSRGRLGVRARRHRRLLSTGLCRGARQRSRPTTTVGFLRRALIFYPPARHADSSAC